MAGITYGARSMPESSQHPGGWIRVSVYTVGDWNKILERLYLDSPSVLIRLHGCGSDRRFLQNLRWGR